MYSSENWATTHAPDLLVGIIPLHRPSCLETDSTRAVRGVEIPLPSRVEPQESKALTPVATSQTGVTSPSPEEHIKVVALTTRHSTASHLLHAANPSPQRTVARPVWVDMTPSPLSVYSSGSHKGARPSFPTQYVVQPDMSIAETKQQASRSP